uniref:hypothetical protein n=1 Tax=Roseovarius sp. BRH_c41 TaxID=1629709 RepID=UPI0025D604B9|nr:hypothetical protein [Roseovarius sp. BRH_c41]
MEDLDSKPVSWHAMRDRLIESAKQLPDEASEEAQRAEIRSQSMELMCAFFDEGIRIAKERGLEPGSADAWEILETAYDVAKDIELCGTLIRLPFSIEERAKLNSDEVRRIFRVTHDAHPRNLISDAMRGQKMNVDKAGLENSVGRYLRSEFRPRFADRALLVALIDMEVTAFLTEIYEKNIVTGRSAASTMNRKPVVMWLIGRCWATLSLVIVVAAIIGIHAIGWIGEETALLLIVGAGFLFAISTVWSFIAYLSFRQRWKGLHPKLVSLPCEMINLYKELHSDGPLSVKRVRQEIERIAVMGAVWSGAVWALLDDMEARGVITITE